MARYQVVGPPPGGAGGWCVYDGVTRSYVAMGMAQAEAEIECERLMDAARKRFEQRRADAATEPRGDAE